MDMCASFWLFNSNPEIMCCKCLIETLTELMSKLGIVEESSKPSLAYLPRKKFLTDFTLNSNAAPTSQSKFNLLPSVSTHTSSSAGVPMRPWREVFPSPPSTPQVTLAVFPPTPPQPSFVDRFLLPSTPLPLPTLPPPPPPFVSFYNSESVDIIMC
jgi:hypothetical protein